MKWNDWKASMKRQWNELIDDVVAFPGNFYMFSKSLYAFLVEDIFSIVFTRGFRVWLAICFFIHQNHYFHWNAEPQSDAELLADGLTILLFMLALWPKSKTTVILNNYTEEK